MVLTLGHRDFFRWPSHDDADYVKLFHTFLAPLLARNNLGYKMTSYELLTMLNIQQVSIWAWFRQLTNVTLFSITLYAPKPRDKAPILSSWISSSCLVHTNFLFFSHKMQSLVSKYFLKICSNRVIRDAWDFHICCLYYLFGRQLLFHPRAFKITVAIIQKFNCPEWVSLYKHSFWTI